MRTAAFLLAFALSGALLSLAFPPYSHSWLAWFAVSPAILAASRSRRDGALLGGILHGAVMCGMLLFWLWGLFGGEAFLPWFIFALFQGILYYAVSIVCQGASPHRLPWAVPPIVVAMEFVRSELFLVKFAWFTLGHSQASNLALLQTASVGGVYLLSLVVALVNATIAWLLAHPSWRRGLVLAGVALIVGGLHLAGRDLPPVAGGGLDIVGIEGEGKPVEEFLKRTQAEPTYVELHIVHEPRLMLVVWPEYAVEGRLDPGHARLVRIAQFSSAHGVPILFGASRSANGKPPDDFENTLFLLAPEGIVQTQVKSVPVPFFADGQPAKERKPLDVEPWPFNGLRVGAATCYDMNFPFVSEELVRGGAEVLVFPTMDALSWGRVEHEQDASLTPLRAVEHRRWIVRVASSGVSQVVDPYGRIVEKTGVNQDAVIRARVLPHDELTLYTRFGYWLPHACAFVTAVLLLQVLLRACRRFRPSAAPPQS